MNFLLDFWNLIKIKTVDKGKIYSLPVSTDELIYQLKLYSHEKEVLGQSIIGEGTIDNKKAKLYPLLFTDTSFYNRTFYFKSKTDYHSSEFEIKTEFEVVTEKTTNAFFTVDISNSIDIILLFLSIGLTIFSAIQLLLKASNFLLTDTKLKLLLALIIYLYLKFKNHFLLKSKIDEYSKLLKLIAFKRFEILENYKLKFY